MLIPVYSIAKSFTAAAVITTGISLDSAVGDYLDCPATTKGLSVRSLLNHTSGLPDYGAWPEYRAAVAAREVAWTADEFLDRARKMPLQPGPFAYSNIGYGLVRLLLQQVTNQPDLFKVLQHTLFAELGMHEVAPLLTTSDWLRAAPSTSDVSDYDPGWVFTGTFLASVESIETGYCSLLRGELFDPALLLDVVHVDAPGHVMQEPGYGLGLMASGRPPQVVGHGGGGPGYTIAALVKRDGSAAAVEWAPAEVSDQPLFRAALDRLSHHSSAVIA